MQYIKLFKLRIKMMMRMLIFCLFHLLWTSYCAPFQNYDVIHYYELNFTSIGDWGCYLLGEPYYSNQLRVASAMASRCDNDNCKFVINTGDNFYPNASLLINNYKNEINDNTNQYINNINEKNLYKNNIWYYNYENVYDYKSLMIPWYSILGNHDYYVNPDVQILYQSENYNRWKLIDRYYDLSLYKYHFPIDINFIFLDTSPCINEYRDSTINKNKEMHYNIIQEDCNKQYNWFKKTVRNYVDLNEKMIVIGHHPIYDITFEDNNTNFMNVFKKYDNHIIMYISGHKHRLEHYHIKDCKTEFIISGGGCQNNNDYDLNEMIKYYEKYPLQIQKKDIDKHTHTIIYKNNTLGFINHYLKYDEYTKKIIINNKFYDKNNNEIYSFDI